MEIGTTLLDKYRVDEVLGTGGMGRVVRASHLFLQQEVAIKILLPHMAENAETVSRFLREAQATSKLKSEHIVHVFDAARMPDGTPFMVMEYLRGNDLNQVLRHHGPQRSQIVCDLMLQACEGMAEAHAQSIVHRDIKPSNFFITTRADGTMLLKILDFGISKTPVGVTELTGSSTVIGTPTYMSPEQMKSGKAADARSDIWSMGIVMYQLLNGRPPFVGESYAELVIKVGNEQPPPIGVPLPPGLMQVILTCLDKNPAARQQSVAELARMLAPYASDPVQGAQSAARTTRILANRGSTRGMDALPITAGGGLAPSSPQLAPRGWPPGAMSNSSVSQARGQVTHTHKVRGTYRTGRLIAAALVLVGLAGAGGYFVNHMLRDGGDGDESTHVAAPATDPNAKPDVAKPEPAKPEPKPEAKPEVAAKPEAKPEDHAETKPEAKADEPKELTLTAESTHASAPLPPVPSEPEVTAKTEPAKPEVTAKTEPAKPETKPEIKPSVTTTKPTTTTTPKSLTTTTTAATKPTTTTKPPTTTTKPTTTTAKTETKPPVKKPPKKRPSNDLFNTRH